jgi:hypothetical protein
VLRTVWLVATRGSNALMFFRPLHFPPMTAGPHRHARRSLLMALDTKPVTGIRWIKMGPM